MKGPYLPFSPHADTAHCTPTERDRKDYYFIMDIIYLKPSSAMKHYEGTYPQMENPGCTHGKH